MNKEAKLKKIMENESGLLNYVEHVAGPTSDIMSIYPEFKYLFQTMNTRSPLKNE